jgi:predicted DNA-binding protein with PD1-like motif
LSIISVLSLFNILKLVIFIYKFSIWISRVSEIIKVNVKKKFMRKIIFISVLLQTLILPCCRQGEEKMHGYEVRTPDQVTRNDSVPDVYNVKSEFKTVIIARFKHKTDMLEGLKSTVETEKIKNAVILSGIGSVSSYHLHSVDNNTFPTENIFMQRDVPMDILSVNGYIFNGRVHAHVSLSDENSAIGGHLEPGTEVFTFCIITLGILDDELSIERFDDVTLR